MKKIKVIMNWDNRREDIVEVNEDFNKSQINAEVERIYGIYDVKEWVEL